MEKMNEIVVYQPNEILNLEVHVEKESVRLSLNQMAILFDRDKSVVSRHISNIFKEKELAKDSTVAKYATVQTENGRTIVRQIEYYNLDVIISVGSSHKELAWRIFVKSHATRCFIDADEDWIEKHCQRIRTHKLCSSYITGGQADALFYASKLSDNK